jgi:hypothetical protein
VQAHVEHGPHVALRVARDDEGVVEQAPHHVVAVLGDLRLVRDEHPGAAEEPPLFELEDFGVVVDVRRDHSAADLVEDLPVITHRCDSSLQRPQYLYCRENIWIVEKTLPGWPVDRQRMVGAGAILPAVIR